MTCTIRHTLHLGYQINALAYITLNPLLLIATLGIKMVIQPSFYQQLQAYQKLKLTGRIYYNEGQGKKNSIMPVSESSGHLVPHFP